MHLKELSWGFSRNGTIIFRDVIEKKSCDVRSRCMKSELSASLRFLVNANTVHLRLSLIVMCQM